MAFEPDQAAADWQVLLEIALTGLTARYADVETTLDDGTIYEGYLDDLSPLEMSAGEILSPRVMPPFMEATLRNHDDVVRVQTDTYEFGNKAVTGKLGQGLTSTDFDTIFTGIVRFPGGVSYWDDNEVRIEFDDARSKDSKVLPVNRFDPSTYTNLETKSYYSSIPLVYGSWLTTDAGGEKVPCFCTDTSNKSFKIADHALKQIEVVYKDGVDITSDCTLDAANGEFQITGATTYDPDTETVTANVQGATDDGTTSGALLQTLPEIFDDILQTHLSVAAGDIDSTAITSWGNSLQANDTGRRWIGVEVESDDLISDLLVDGFADLKISGGKYTPVYRTVSVSGTPTTYADSEIRPREDGSKEFAVLRDPERTYCNEVVADYKYDPTTADYTVTYTKQKTDAIARLGTTKRRRMQFNWLYQQAAVERRTDREVYAYSTEPEVVELLLDPTGMTLEPTDQFRLLYSKFDLGSDVGTPFQVRQIALDFGSMTARVRAVNMNNLSPGRWTVNGANAWTAATVWEQETQGFWTNAAGEADTGDSTSIRSIWW